MTMNFRNNFARLSEALLDEGARDSSVKVLDKCLTEMPDKTVPFNMIMLRVIEMYYRNAMAAEPVDLFRNLMLRNYRNRPRPLWKKEI